MLVSAECVYATTALPTVVQVDVTSLFNSDVIINVNLQGLDTSQSPVDTPSFGASNNALLTQQAAVAIGLNDPDGLPNNGFFAANANHPDVQFAYPNSGDGNNSRRLNEPGVFNVTTPQHQYSQMHLFATSGQGESTFAVRWDYADGNVWTNSIVVPRWFDDPAATADRYFLVNGLDRAKVNATGAQNSNDAAIFGFRLLPDPLRTLTGFAVSVTDVPAGDNFRGAFVFFGATGVTAPIPEPRTAVLVALCCALFLRRRVWIASDRRARYGGGAGDPLAGVIWAVGSSCTCGASAATRRAAAV